MVAQEAARTLGQPFVIENRAGAAGNLGAEAVAKAAPDGYTALYGIGSVVTTNPWLYRDLRFDPMRDLLPVTLTNAGGGFVLVVSTAAPWQTFSDLVSHARRHPGALNYASYGSGSAPHLVMEMMKGRGSLFLTHIPYRGAAPALNALLGQQVDVMFDTLVNTLPYIRSGRLRPLAVSTARRMAQLPQVPAVAESYAGFRAEGWHGVFLPAGVPREIASRLDEALQRALKAPAVEKWMEDNGLRPGALGGEAFAAFVRADHAQWGAVVRERDIRPD
jgi:tripartite-type tricarboxylate transporter receptor subunit TctC